MWFSEEPVPRRRRLQEEAIDRYGRWVRTFSVRSEPWSVIEHWASELGFDLLSIRGDRRVYARQSRWGWFCETIEFKQHDRRMHISASILVSLIPRILSLFAYPEEINLVSTSFVGARVRRQYARDLNGLLIRFRQEAIIGSDGIHVADIELSTMIFAATLLIPFAGFLLLRYTHSQSIFGFNRIVLENLGNEAFLFGGMVVAFLILQVAVSRIFAMKLVGWITSGVFAVVFFILLGLTLSRNGVENREYAFTYHCLHHYDPAQCRAAINGLPVKEQEGLMGKVLSLEKELSLRR